MKISAYCLLSGDKFNDMKLQELSGIEISERNGIGSFASTDFIDDKHEILDNLLNKLVNNYTNLIDSGVAEISVTLNLQYEKQCNWEVTLEQVRKLNFLKAVLSFSAYTE